MGPGFDKFSVLVTAFNVCYHLIHLWQSIPRRAIPIEEEAGVKSLALAGIPWAATEGKAGAGPQDK